MKIHDVSVALSSQLPTWPGDPKIILERVSKIEEGSDANVSRLDMGLHTGTHIDAPYHFISSGETVDKMPLDLLIGPVVVVELPLSVKIIKAIDLMQAQLPENCPRLLLKTSNSKIWERGEKEFQRDFVALSKDGAEFLVEHGVKLVGIDYLSIAPFNESIPPHVALLSAGVVVIEGLDLSKVEPGEYQLFCLPLKLDGAEGAPARVILLEN